MLIGVTYCESICSGWFYMLASYILGNEYV